MPRRTQNAQEAQEEEKEERNRRRSRRKSRSRSRSRSWPRRTQDAQEAIQEAIDLFITYAQVSEPTLEGRIARLEKMLRDMAAGSWCFSHDFDIWRDAHYGAQA